MGLSVCGDGNLEAIYPDDSTGDVDPSRAEDTVDN